MHNFTAFILKIQKEKIISEYYIPYTADTPMLYWSCFMLTMTNSFKGFDMKTVFSQ
jgi:hypothetical protein